MPFWNQISQAIRCQIEDFFRVRWQAVALMLIVIAGIIDTVFVRVRYSMVHLPPYWGVHLLVAIACFLALSNVPRFLK